MIDHQLQFILLFHCNSFQEQLNLVLIDNLLMGHTHRFNDTQTSTEPLQSFEEIWPLLGLEISDTYFRIQRESII